MRRIRIQPIGPGRHVNQPTGWTPVQVSLVAKIRHRDAAAPIPALRRHPPFAGRCIPVELALRLSTPRSSVGGYPTDAVQNI
ncbi:hypothetical protein L838_0475 [Mycobacterium avium MAV_120709_2344]|nr:hypothetical protein L839_4699 [Mycobacterium avium MAV_120809_2495]ETZ55152.1 hypothetical protein L840_4206 [Mycobacterium sp. MAC_011194_8550]ETZ57082.1 hypothetical protein L838_0475 [Mycobacterium avium MAV_120709_2344]ETZ72445.1 hypothetical protein L841_0635 [Mycobacterium sp. MAC_080597_8934]